MDTPFWKRESVSISGLFLFIYFALGALYPLLSHYLKSIGMSGTEIGLIVSVGPIVAIFAQPFWGMLCDRFQVSRQILSGVLLGAMGASLLLLAGGKSFMALALLYGVLHFFQSGAVPISDGLALQYAARTGVEFGSIRQWGAIGFAAATLITGLLADFFWLGMIFYVYAFAQISAFFFLQGMRSERSMAAVNIVKGLRELIRLPRYMLFLASAFLIFGPINGNNVFFGLLYEQMGGQIAGIGLAFLLFAGSEAPFMKWSGFFIRRLGLEKTIFVAGIVSALRWIWYGTSPSPTAVLLLFFVQGFSVGLYLASATQFIRANTPEALRVTALAIYTSMGLGLGSMATNVVGGMLVDAYGILTTYTFFGALTLLGLVPLMLVIWVVKQKQSVLQ
ncbi:MFS transporter [Aneurinibacillus sp. BA2021]|nr:MFS transporter [Aneurinibacillus sp. BA2021]